MPYPGINGFLGTRASLMLDVVVVAMTLVLPTLAGSIALVKYRRRYALHKTIQLVLGAVLLTTVLLFEADMRISGWRERARPSRFWGSESTAVGGAAENWVDFVLALHVLFAATTAVLWITVILRALRQFPRPPAPNGHSSWHLRWGKLAAIDMLLTALSGWLFYWMAFVA